MNWLTYLGWFLVAVPLAIIALVTAVRIVQICMDDGETLGVCLLALMVFAGLLLLKVAESA